MLNHYDNSEISYREELILKISILTETYSPNFNWYIDIILNLIVKSE